MCSGAAKVFGVSHQILWWFLKRDRTGRVVATAVLSAAGDSLLREHPVSRQGFQFLAVNTLVQLGGALVPLICTRSNVADDMALQVVGDLSSEPATVRGPR